MRTTELDITFYATQSRFSDPGTLADWAGAVDPDAAVLRAVASGLVFHFRGMGDHGFPPERRAEIDLRYAEDIFARLYELNPAPVRTERAPIERVVGCCRDFTLLLVAMARGHGIPARSRTGFATYLVPGWAVDHTIAEVWDAEQRRWRLMDPQFAPGYLDPTDGAELDVLDVPSDRFLVAADAWAACRGGADPERFVVSPDQPAPFLRGWPYLMHNLVLDLAALNKYEMILWDLWGPLNTTARVDSRTMAEMDALSALLRDSRIGIDCIRGAFEDRRLRVPSVIRTVTPFDGVPRQVVLR
ncbi:transglutaminase-like domain-containing protein [Nocardia iowensis]|uniref:Transglutaminase domain-containing protein n=1 Tax=Nocardia iowensis TaxID=204891 RepID=A0ABX8RKY8_NOCIO|nr:transglutaminase domain-containing protein [Nocardia iowensis]QXN89582.1 transglutaminase domain-containing protein [Nocardia iowensis]